MAARPASGRRRRALAGVLTAAATLAASGILLGVAPVAHAETPETCPTTLKTDGLSALAHLNGVRKKAGQRAVSESGDLMAIAAAHSAAMAAAGKIFHNPDLTSQVPNWEVLGENVGSGGSVPYVDACFDWSHDHYENEIGSAYTQVGIGIASRGGAVYVTVDFRKPMYATTAAPAPKPATKPAPKKAPVTHSGARTTTSLTVTTTTPARHTAASRAAAARREAALRAAAAAKARAGQQRARVAAVRAAAAHEATGTGSDPVGRALSFSRTLTALAG